ncbi:uncharacterized protein LOC144355725, partial [Saccoglossus kowalevskii]
DTGAGSVVNIADDVDAGSDFGETGDEADGGGPGGVLQGAGRGKGRKPRMQRKELSTKQQDFQVRVKVWEARQLQGANIHPVCKVTVANQTKMTRVKHSTNTPIWQEIFFFNFHMSPAELFDEVIGIQVFNSRKLRSDALIGGFNFDIGMVYEESQHSFLNKWLLLTGSDESQSGVKGYCKISVCVLGSGDEAPTFKKSQGDEDDIESNLLRPAGIQLRKATFILRAYRAEDIPQMDPGYFEGVKKILGVGEEQKELVDPYCVFQFAGKSAKTKCIYTCDHPEWNQELRLGIRVFSRGVTIQVFSRGVTIQVFSRGVTVQVFSRGVTMQVFSRGVTMQVFSSGVTVQVFSRSVTVQVFSRGVTVQVFSRGVTVQVFSRGVTVQVFSRGVTMQVFSRGVTMQVFSRDVTVQVFSKGVTMQVFSRGVTMQVFSRGVTMQVFSRGVTMQVFSRGVTVQVFSKGVTMQVFSRGVTMQVFSRGVTMQVFSRGVTVQVFSRGVTVQVFSRGVTVQVLVKDRLSADDTVGTYTLDMSAISSPGEED